MKGAFVLLLILVGFSGMAFGQTLSQWFLVQDSIAGMSYVTDLPVTAIRYGTPGKIYRWHWDGNSDNLLLELRETNKKGKSFKNGGTLNMVGLSDKELKWVREVNYNSSELKQQGSYYFLTDKKKNFCIDPETGAVLWENKNDFYFIEPFLNIGVGYPIQSMSNKLTAVNLSNGKELWYRDLDRSFGWDDAYMLNDSVLLISTNGLRAVHLVNGAGWSYKANTTKKEIGKMIGVNAFGLLLGVFTGVYTYQDQPDVASDMVSNMLIDPDESIVLASRDQIARVDNAGNVLWTTPLPEKITSKSSLFLVDSVVYMINRGYAQYNGGFSMIGDPYLAAFDLKTGNRLYLTLILEKKEFIRNFQVVNDMLFVVFEDKIGFYRLGDGTLIKEKVIELQKDEHLDAFVESGIYWKRNDSEFTDLMSEFSNYNLMMTTQGRVFVLTDSLERVFAYDKEELYHIATQNPRCALITNNDSDFVVLDASDNPVAALKASGEMFLYRDKLYFFDKDSFSEIDLSQLGQPAPASVWQSIFKQVSGFIPDSYN
ncbi:MAG: hypothetical protein BGO34_20870 [Bacteroidia bacterium 44-10]|nr:MAG: hypothetical protein BGO34_20870 [Bacteroidia bacterium 44-10]